MKSLLYFIMFLVVGCRPQGSKPANLPIKIYLEDFDPANLDHDIKFLREFHFVTTVRFVSKEEAKKEYIADGNQDWSAVLEENPLPDSYTVLISTNEFTRADMDDFRSKVMEQIKNSTDIQFPEILLPER